MGVENLVHTLGRLSSIQLKQSCSRQIQSPAEHSGMLQSSLGQSETLDPGFSGTIPFNLEVTAPGCTIYSGLLIWMRVVLQDVSGGPYGW